MLLSRDHITGLILAGGRGSRMGGTDKGLQPFRGAPLALHALRRLQPQVGALLINANRNLDIYQGFGTPVIADRIADYAGPLAGMAAGLAACKTPWLAVVPCDSPLLPADLVERLADAAIEADAEFAMAVTIEADGRRQAHPVFCLMRVDLLNSLTQFLQTGGRKIDAWSAQLKTVEVPFDETDAFANINTPEALRALTDGR